MSDFPTAKAINSQEAALLSRAQNVEQKAKNLKSQKIDSPKDINKAASGFEALLLHEMLKSMGETVETTGLLGEDSNQAQIYMDMFHQAVADTISEGRGMGIKEFVRRELEKGNGASKGKADSGGD